MRRNGKAMIVYVVDDEYPIASALELILLAKGYDSRSFADPLDALEAARSNSPDLLISDVAMPNMNGIELAIQITQICPACKVLLFSGQMATGALYSDAQAKGYGFELLAKPVHLNELFNKIEELNRSGASL